jgi:hypothetical protein
VIKELAFLFEGRNDGPKEEFCTQGNNRIEFRKVTVPALGEMFYCLVKEETEPGVWKITHHTWGCTKLDAFIAYMNEVSNQAVTRMRAQDPPSMTEADPVRAEDYLPPGVSRLMF